MNRKRVTVQSIQKMKQIRIVIEVSACDRNEGLAISTSSKLWKIVDKNCS